MLCMMGCVTGLFIPVLMMGGVLGRMCHELAVTIGVAILVRGFVPPTLTPMLCSRFLRPPKEAKHGRFYEATERVYQRSLAFYERTLGWVMDHRPATMAFSLGILVATGLLYPFVPKGFIPTEVHWQIPATTETL